MTDWFKRIRNIAVGVFSNTRFKLPVLKDHRWSFKFLTIV